MARVYLDKLTRLIADLKIQNEVKAQLEPRHFFNGAALYADNSICASWSPAGLAFKLPESQVTQLIASGNARPLKYFDKGPVKKNYALFENPEAARQSEWKNYLLAAVGHAS